MGLFCIGFLGFHLCFYLILQLQFFWFLPVLYFCASFHALLLFKVFLHLLHIKILSSSLSNFSTAIYSISSYVSFHVLLCLQSFLHLLHLKMLSSSLSNFTTSIFLVSSCLLFLCKLLYASFIQSFFCTYYT